MRFLSSSCRGGTENPPTIVDPDNPGTTDPDNPGTTDPETPSATITITNGDGLHAPSDTVQLYCSPASGAVTWTSSDETLATVDLTGLVSVKPRTDAITIQDVTITAQSNGVDVGNITIPVGDYSYDESKKTYHIYSELGLNYWAQKESENDQSFNVNLERDITMKEPAKETSNWTGILDYNATFDGQGHTIKGLTLNIMINHPQCHGFFRSIGSDAVIRNLNLTDVHIYSISQFIGAIAGESYGAIEDCTVSGSVEGEMYVGGIAGNQKGGCISGCYNHCNVQANNISASAGGVAGNANCTISNCYNYGTITATGYNVVAAGGIVGQTGLSAIINDCHNSGNISGENVTYSDDSDQRLYLGGIVGWLYGSSSSVTNCSIKDGIKIDASYYSSWLNEEAAVDHIVGKGTEGSGNKGIAKITKTDLSSSGTSTSP